MDDTYHLVWNNMSVTVAYIFGRYMGSKHERRRAVRNKQRII